jgi:phosphoadenosine phosphosulfate reductase
MNNKPNIELLNKWNDETKNFNPPDLIKWAINIFGEQNIVLASSLGIEDQILTHIILNISKNVKIFTIDTGRLFQETYSTIARTEERYGFKFDIYFPDYKMIEPMVKEKGVNLFYNSIDDRKLCCHVRKIEPLQRALKNKKCWICGLRQEQAVTRKNISVVEFDELNGLYKLNPLYNWTIDDCWDFIKKNNIPYNTLHDKGFPSIGCMPCTRAIKEGEDIRAGRWWWENPEHKECGLHKR